MYIKNGIYREVSAANLTAPIAAGTVVTVNGNIAAEDGHDAYGIVPENINNISPTGRIYVCVGGTIDLHSPANAGITFSDAVIKALGQDINFVPAIEIPEPPPELPKPEAGDAGLLVAVNSDADGYELVEPSSGGGIPVIDLTTVTPTSFRHLDNTLSILVSGVPVVFVDILQSNDVVAVKLPYAFYDNGAFDLDPDDAFLTLVGSWEYESDLRLKALNFFGDEQGNAQYGFYDFMFTH